MCIIEGCKCDKMFAKGMCYRHYTQIRKYGKISDQINDGENIINIKDGIAIMDLYDRRGNKIAETIFNVEDIDKVKEHFWHRTDLQRSTYYCRSNKLGRLHRYILEVSDDSIVVDHINHNGLDNRRCNLRVCTNSQNICNCCIPKNNKSGHKGVYWDSNRKKWNTQITINKKTIHLGRYDNIEDAIRVRNEAAKKYYGEFANEV